MIDRRFMIVFVAIFSIATISSLMVWRLFFIERSSAQNQNESLHACTYEEIDLVMPVEAFLKRCASSSSHSYVRRLFVNQWIASNKSDLISLVVYAQGAKTYEDLKKALLIGVEKVGESTGAASFINGGLKVLNEDPTLIDHVNKSLAEGFDQKIYTLRGQIMSVQKDSAEYEHLKTQYRKLLEQWIDEKHGKLLDEIIAKL